MTTWANASTENYDTWRRRKRVQRGEAKWEKLKGNPFFFEISSPITPKGGGEGGEGAGIQAGSVCLKLT